jgi:hypothetical protein
MNLIYTGNFRRTYIPESRECKNALEHIGKLVRIDQGLRLCRVLSARRRLDGWIDIDFKESV